MVASRIPELHTPDSFVSFPRDKSALSLHFPRTTVSIVPGRTPEWGEVEMGETYRQDRT